jgi:hypothetical protein
MVGIDRETGETNRENGWGRVRFCEAKRTAVDKSDGFRSDSRFNYYNRNEPIGLIN